ncbi:SsrA-binding protein SmpB [Mycoplasma hyorhinis]|uniref:SsrA-binding protein SmpB n=1 Tax=Mesomycoplasma hyorhinis TaxID=2100 RepID=UPI00136C17A3|nr:SsrA-binding protein SmpB [Mesomycoplasma hyorhinis]MXR09007.1 SsrA-binding protein SmpB [Mesomycoplasma hyorhinis]
MKIIAKNKVAYYDYEILETFEAGISLMGWEVKSIRANKVNLKNSFAYFKDLELYWSNAHISLYMAVKGDEQRTRKLLMHKSELKKIYFKKTTNRLTLIPLSLYWKQGKIKLELALAKGKTKYDKRQSEKAKEEKRKIEKMLKNYS